MQEIAAHATADALAAHLAARDAVKEAKLTKEHNAQLAALRAELALKQTSPVEDLRRQIIEDVLTLRCPRCAHAFLDFDGCMALTCNAPDSSGARGICGVSFCAICGKDCGSSCDAHEHVRQCAFGNGSLYATASEVQVLQNKAREGKLKKMLRQLERGTVHAALAGLKREFGDIGLSFTAADLV